MPYQQSGNTHLFYTYELRLVMLMEYPKDDKNKHCKTLISPILENSIRVKHHNPNPIKSK
jgi:hypothetical protein